jgi:hypothetical protein
MCLCVRARVCVSVCTSMLLILPLLYHIFINLGVDNR